VQLRGGPHASYLRRNKWARPAILPFDWADPFDLNHQLTDEERMVRDTAQAYARDNLQPRVTEAYLNENFDREILREMGGLGLLGATIPEVYGGAGLGYVSYGLIAREVERVDSGYRYRHVGAELARHAPDPRLRLGGAAQESTSPASPRASWSAASA
jgi:alkylation response protein AidB-like acyl-CoA dehydrogenase